MSAQVSEPLTVSEIVACMKQSVLKLGLPNVDNKLDSYPSHLRQLSPGTAISQEACVFIQHWIDLDKGACMLFSTRQGTSWPKNFAEHIDRKIWEDFRQFELYAPRQRANYVSLKPRISYHIGSLGPLAQDKRRLACVMTLAYKILEQQPAKHRTLGMISQDDEMVQIQNHIEKFLGQILELYDTLPAYGSWRKILNLRLGEVIEESKVVYTKMTEHALEILRVCLRAVDYIVAEPLLIIDHGDDLLHTSIRHKALDILLGKRCKNKVWISISGHCTDYCCYVFPPVSFEDRSHIDGNLNTFKFELLPSDSASVKRLVEEIQFRPPRWRVEGPSVRVMQGLEGVIADRNVGWDKACSLERVSYYIW
ncbi:hypothetical protein HD806DRAFT_530791 [Xylariaceae sp. AK1471]|nr:hypothetical protein HD806DRAFT_530791 [Xylariaceae sp. AK1471]